MIIMAVALVALPTMAQQELWQSTSVMPRSGSTYSPQVTAVGANEAPVMGTTTGNNTQSSARPGHIRKSQEGNTEIGPGNPGSPIGDAFWPLMLLALAYMSLRVFLKRKRA